MHLAVLVLVIYVLYAEWRSFEQRNAIIGCRRNLEKLEGGKTLWYSGVLPEAGEACLFQTVNGEYVISRLDDKRWLKKDGTVDFSKIKRWVYLKDLDNL